MIPAGRMAYVKLEYWANGDYVTEILNVSGIVAELLEDGHDRQAFDIPNGSAEVYLQ